MKTYLLLRGGQTRELKNLGWLLRNWKRVARLGFNYSPDSARMVDGVLIGYMRDGSVYHCEYSSLSVCWHFLLRSVFEGVKLHLRKASDNYNSERVFTIGDPDYRRINHLGYAEQMNAILC